MQTDRQTNRRKYTDVKFAPQKTFWLRGGGGRGSLLGGKVRNSRREILVLLSLVRRHLGNKRLWETDGGVSVRRGGGGGGGEGGCCCGPRCRPTCLYILPICVTMFSC